MGFGGAGAALSTRKVGLGNPSLSLRALYSVGSLSTRCTIMHERPNFPALGQFCAAPRDYWCPSGNRTGLQRPLDIPGPCEVVTPPDGDKPRPRHLIAPERWGDLATPFNKLVASIR